MIYCHFIFKVESVVKGSKLSVESQRTPLTIPLQTKEPTLWYNEHYAETSSLNHRTQKYKL